MNKENTRYAITGLLALTVMIAVTLLRTPVQAVELTQVKPGVEAPVFTLTDVAGESHSLADYMKDGKIVILEWFNPDCPYVVKYHKPGGNNSMREAYAYAKEQGFVWLAINSGAPGKQGHGLERNTKAIQEYGMSYPVLLDESGKVGMSYVAQNTPQIFIVKDGKVVYNGGVDDTKTADQQPTQKFLLAALKNLAAGEPIAQAETMHPGCGVKYADN